MVCLGCRVICFSGLCSTCASDLRPAPDRLVDGGLIVRTAFAHQGPARALVHHYKYRGIDRAGRFLAGAMAGLIPPRGVLVPLPRAGWRQMMYGIDPARTLAGHLARLTGRPTVDLLETSWYSSPQAGTSRSRRHPPIFTPRWPDSLPDAIVLIDDVVTTGHTLRQAATVLGEAVVCAVTATASGD
ncbi:MAG: ComF family protein [Actinomycetota bacterium]